MKNQIVLLLTASVVLFTSCNKDEDDPPISESYINTIDFLSTNESIVQTYSVDAVAGGSFTSSKGTTVTIPANAFITQAGSSVTGTITIEFKDIYEKSEMLLSLRQTVMNNGRLLKSGGEFYIKALLNHVEIKMAPGKIISVAQPNEGIAADSMDAFVSGDSIGSEPMQNFWWWESYSNYVTQNTNNYTYSITKFETPLTSGTWCNSDNPWHYSSNTLTTLTCSLTESVEEYGTEVFLVFSNTNSIVHVPFLSWSTRVFRYLYAPVGANCTVVAIGVKDGNPYSSFTPLIIGTNQTLSVSLTATNTATFRSQLDALN